MFSKFLEERNYKYISALQSEKFPRYRGLKEATIVIEKQLNDYAIHDCLDLILIFRIDVVPYRIPNAFPTYETPDVYSYPICSNCTIKKIILEEGCKRFETWVFESCEIKKIVIKTSELPVFSGPIGRIKAIVVPEALYEQFVERYPRLAEIARKPSGC